MNSVLQQKISFYPWCPLHLIIILFPQIDKKKKQDIWYLISAVKAQSHCQLPITCQGTSIPIKSSPKEMRCALGQIVGVIQTNYRYWCLQLSLYYSHISFPMIKRKQFWHKCIRFDFYILHTEQNVYFFTSLVGLNKNVKLRKFVDKWPTLHHIIMSQCL